VETLTRFLLLFVPCCQRRRRDRLVAELVAGVRGVGDQEDVALRIDGVHHQVQQLENLGLGGLRMHSRI